MDINIVECGREKVARTEESRNPFLVIVSLKIVTGYLFPIFCKVVIRNWKKGQTSVTEFVEHSVSRIQVLKKKLAHRQYRPLNVLAFRFRGFSLYRTPKKNHGVCSSFSCFFYFQKQYYLKTQDTSNCRSSQNSVSKTEWTLK